MASVSKRTINTRKKIGFPSQKEDWAKAPANYSMHTLRIAGHPVMEDWEKSYMEKLAKIASSNNGHILEIGYGLGLSAKAIQSNGVVTHSIIECHPDVLTRCIKDFRKAIATGKLRIISGFWENVTPGLPTKSFDGILFDTYPLKEEEIHSNHFWFFNEAYRLLKPGGVFTYYSDEIDHYSDDHLSKLQEAGFKRKNIFWQICRVKPPKNCEYWVDKTILAPIIIK